jgi:ribosomal protein S25
MEIQPQFGSQAAYESYLDAATRAKKPIPTEEMDEIISTLSKVEIDSSIAEVISSDPNESSLVIPYYRNNKHRIYSVFEKYPDDLEIIQNLNLYLINEIPKASLVRIEFPQPGIKTSLKFSKLGSSTELNKFLSELIYLLEIRKDIDYAMSTYKGYSKLASWLLKTIGKHKRESGVIHVVLQPRDHEFLTEILKTKSDTLVYRAFLQTISLLAEITTLPITLTACTIRLNKLLKNEIPNLVLKRNLSDISDVEPYYIWASVTTPEERGVLTKTVKKNFFQEQNKILRKLRTKDNLTAHKELVNLKKEVDKELPNGVKATLYGRLKFYNHLKTQKDTKDSLAKRQGTKQLSIAEVHRHAKERGVLSLFSPDNIIATALGVVNKPTELIDLTKMIKFNPDTDHLFYYRQDIESSLTFKSLLTRESEGIITQMESLFLSAIISRCVQFVPGVDRRF